MVLLVHHSVSPQSRKARIMMAEKKILFVLKEEEPWNLSKDIQKLNPAKDLPVFIFDGHIISGNYAVTEYLEENYKEVPLLKGDALQRAEIRRLCDWFDQKFYMEVYKYIVGEKVFKRFKSGGAPAPRLRRCDGDGRREVAGCGQGVAEMGEDEVLEGVADSRRHDDRHMPLPERAVLRADDAADARTGTDEALLANLRDGLHGNAHADTEDFAKVAHRRENVSRPVVARLNGRAKACGNLPREIAVACAVEREGRCPVGGLVPHKRQEVYNK